MKYVDGWTGKRSRSKGKEVNDNKMIMTIIIITMMMMII